MISFGVSYYVGPPSSPRALSLIQWFLQVVSLLSTFLCTDYTEAALILVILELVIYNFPYKILSIYFSWANSFFIHSRNNLNRPLMLTEEEFIRQGDIETEKALEELREFLKSPKCNAWKTVSRIKNKDRFISFVEGNSHVDDDEISAYEESLRSRSFSELEISNSSNEYEIHERDDDINDLLTDDEDDDNKAKRESIDRLVSKDHSFKNGSSTRQLQNLFRSPPRKSPPSSSKKRPATSTPKKR